MDSHPEIKNVSIFEISLIKKEYQPKIEAKIIGYLTIFVLIVDLIAMYGFGYVLYQKFFFKVFKLIGGNKDK
jgi:hypothetical protein